MPTSSALVLTPWDIENEALSYDQKKEGSDAVVSPAARISSCATIRGAGWLSPLDWKNGDTGWPSRT
ncbi:hypothetical protein HYQ46_001382 [Verticillium longisporum]|nr:hypothetical protein HYQ44_006961 [Verticillium longisporum]KAG7152996.1 hypothetical protein HYQ46_001382 [Verticillium longisporum]